MSKERIIAGLVALVACILYLTCCASGTAKDVVSTVEKQVCFICGDWSGTIMEIVGRNDSVGLVYLNEPTIIDTMVWQLNQDQSSSFQNTAS